MLALSSNPGCVRKSVQQLSLCRKAGFRGVGHAREKRIKEKAASFFSSTIARRARRARYAARHVFFWHRSSFFANAGNTRPAAKGVRQHSSGTDTPALPRHPVFSSTSVRRAPRACYATRHVSSWCRSSFSVNAGNIRSDAKGVRKHTSGTDTPRRPEVV